MYPAYFVHGIDGSRYEEPKPPAPGYDLVVFLGELYLGIDQLLRLIPLLCVCPSNALGPRPVFRRFHWYEWLCKTPLAIAWKFVTMPLLSPQDHARRLYKTVNVKGKRRQEAQPPPPKATVRVKWYPDLDTPLKPWPAGLGELWTDLPIEPDGSLDLRPLRRMWGMENIYVRASSAYMF
ncbi:hypothetical protein C8Q73DRAFT_181712 [Cubamyces lactineus]|nr:hypothetical protein C8Q73DRAFT_181712 [Cubamyces lactineus]